MSRGAVSGDLEQNSDTLFPTWLRVGYVGVNGAASLVALGAGVTTGNIAVAESGLQGVAEIGISNTQMKHADKKNHVGDRFRLRIYKAITALSLAGAGVSVGEAVDFWDVGIETPYGEAIGLGASAVAMTTGLVAAGTIGKRLQKRYGNAFDSNNKDKVDTPEHDAIRHIVVKDLPISVIAVSSGYLGLKTGDDWSESMQNYLGIMSGLWGAYLFRPTSKNLEHHQGQNSSEIMPRSVEELDQIHPTDFI